MRTYAYLRTDCVSEETIADFNSLLSYNNYSVQKNRVVFEEITADKSIVYREKFMGVINYSLEQGDLLITKGIDCLGSDYLEILNTIGLIDHKKIRLICLDYTHEELTGDIKNSFLHILKLCNDFEKIKIEYKNQPTKLSLTKKVGRPEKLSVKQKEEIAEKLKMGISIYSLAKKYSVSRTVIRRIINNNTNRIITLPVTQICQY
ncbi:recombinase family protein [Acinetobacter sp. C32I]|uniref:recombinase family protein n=1 Tax=Acinetobacter sp. C32I TaxID=2950074 RepID=UPI0020366B6D|nr:recombinase family protein [Acinetobacter sp. C32I]USA55523.1 recombinase family protein [Acinetobacter sp. C32I]